MEEIVWPEEEGTNSLFMKSPVGWAYLTPLGASRLTNSPAMFKSGSLEAIFRERATVGRNANMNMPGIKGEFKDRRRVKINRN